MLVPLHCFLAHRAPEARQVLVLIHKCPRSLRDIRTSCFDLLIRFNRDCDVRYHGLAVASLVGSSPKVFQICDLATEMTDQRFKALRASSQIAMLSKESKSHEEALRTGHPFVGRNDAVSEAACTRAYPSSPAHGRMLQDTHTMQDAAVAHHLSALL